MKENIEFIMNRLQDKHIWDEMPVYCFTSDVDWASEDVMSCFFNKIDDLDIKLTLFVTHHSKIIDQYYNLGKIDRGIHPNFLSNSSHGKTFREVIETCIKFAPEAYGFRSHRLFDVTDITHLLKNQYNFKYASNLGTVFQTHIKPILHESGLILFPIFFEDGSHLYNQLDLKYKKYLAYFTTPGIKVISFHPMNFVFNSPSYDYMRQLKDSLSREEYYNITNETIKKSRNYSNGIENTVIDIINHVKRHNYPSLTLNELYNKIM